jgi:hypothetical protein
MEFLHFHQGVCFCFMLIQRMVSSSLPSRHIVFGVALLLAISSFCIVSVYAVDRSKFKTCDQANFCQRLRSKHAGAAEPNSPWHVLAESVKVEASGESLSVLIGNTQYPQQPALKAQLDLLVHNVVRMRVHEQNPLHPRYVVQDVLQPAGLQALPTAQLKQGFKVCLFFSIAPPLAACFLVLHSLC